MVEIDRGTRQSGSAMSLAQLPVVARSSPVGNFTGRTADDTMSNELTTRQRAIRLRLAGAAVAEGATSELHDALSVRPYTIS
jgi:hypothetical protein